MSREVEQVTISPGRAGAFTLSRADYDRILDNSYEDQDGRFYCIIDFYKDEKHVRQIFDSSFDIVYKA